MDNTIEAVRLALRVQDMVAQAASINIANGSSPGARAVRFDVEAAQSVLREAAQPSQGLVGGDALRQRLLAADEALAASAPTAGAGAIDLDAEVAGMVAASTRFQALTEALGRQFGLMRLAISGRN
jgi:flagellar basal-body rod protein FlgB